MNIERHESNQRDKIIDLLTEIRDLLKPVKELSREEEEVGMIPGVSMSPHAEELYHRIYDAPQDSQPRSSLSVSEMIDQVRYIYTYLNISTVRVKRKYPDDKDLIFNLDRGIFLASEILNSCAPPIACLREPCHGATATHCETCHFELRVAGPFPPLTEAVEAVCERMDRLIASLVASHNAGDCMANRLDTKVIIETYRNRLRVSLDEQKRKDKESEKFVCELQEQIMAMNKISKLTMINCIVNIMRKYGYTNAFDAAFPGVRKQENEE